MEFAGPADGRASRARKARRRLNAAGDDEIAFDLGKRSFDYRTRVPGAGG